MFANMQIGNCVLESKDSSLILTVLLRLKAQHPLGGLFQLCFCNQIGCKYSQASHAYSEPMNKQQIICEIQATRLFHKYVRFMVSDL